MRRIIMVIFLCVIVSSSPLSYAKKHFVITHRNQVISKGWTHFEGRGKSLTLINDAILIKPGTRRERSRVIFIQVRHYNQYSPGFSGPLTDQVIELTLSLSAGFEVHPCDSDPEQLDFRHEKSFDFFEYLKWLNHDNPTIVTYWINHIKDRSKRGDFWYPDADLYDFVYFSIKNKGVTLHDFDDLQRGAKKAITDDKSSTNWNSFMPCFAVGPRKIRMDVRKRLQSPESDSVLDAVELTQFHESGSGNSFLTIYFSKKHDAQFFSHTTRAGAVLRVKGVSAATHRQVRTNESHRLHSNVLRLLLSPILQETLLQKTFPSATK